MDEIALISDIHGNIPALMAVDEDIKKRGIEIIYCLGDMCGRGPNGSEAIDYYRNNCEVVILGNWDNHVALGRRKDFLSEAGEERQKYLQTLPLHHKMWISGRRLHLLHGRPVINEVIYDDSEVETKMKLFSSIEDIQAPDIVGYADIHRQYKTDFRDGKILFNIGSIGNSFCTPTACYAIIRGMIDCQKSAPISIEFVSVPYDINKAINNAKNASDWFLEYEDYIVEISTATWQPTL